MGSSKPSKTKPKAPQVQRVRVQNVHRTPALLRVEAFSANGRRAYQRVVKVSGLSPAKKRVDSSSSSQIDSMSVDNDWHGLGVGGSVQFAHSGMEELDVVGEDGGCETEQGSKDKEEAALAQTMADWRVKAKDFLHELMVWEGRNPSDKGVCVACTTSDASVYRCRDCIGGRLYCKSCIVGMHKDHPYDRVEKWNGRFFERTTLKDLGLVIQLGHDDGTSCGLRDMARTGFVVVDLDYIQEVSVAYCNCRLESVAGQKWQQLMRRELYPGSIEDPYTAFTFRVLNLFHSLTLKGKITLYDFYYSIELRSNVGGTLDVKDRYESFRRVSRQWRFLKMLKRSGFGNELDRRVEDIKPGELAVQCIACPRPGVNLPQNWQLTPDSQKFLYNKFISLDACFRLKRRAVSSEAVDPGLFTGLAYYVSQQPYKEWVKGAPIQKETSTCTSLAAVKQANSRFNKGYATTGALACICSRHEICEPNGLVDLSKGEKFLLGDYAVGASQRLSSPSLNRVLSYDIFFDRLRSLPPEASVVVDESRWCFVVPKLHIRGHERRCQENYALHLLPGAGQTDGEGIERQWAEVGPIGVSTREMGPGHRRDTIDDHQGARNWRKICGLGYLLRKREAEARRQIEMHTLEYDQFCRSQPSEVIEAWRNRVLDWEGGLTRDNPYSLKEIGDTEEDIRLKMATKEAEDILHGATVVHEMSPSAFISMGLDIEHQQRRLAIELEGWERNTTRQQTSVVDRRARVARLIARFRTIQQLYTPTVLGHLSTLPNASSVDNVEKIPLLLPSELPDAIRLHPALEKWVEMESQFRKAQLRTSMRAIQTHLFVRSGLNIERRTQSRGQKDSTRSRDGMARNELEIQVFRAKYQRAWDALLAMIGEDSLQKEMPGYLVLREQDIRTHDDIDNLTYVSNRARKNAVESPPLLIPGESRRVMSWIWTGIDIEGDSGAMKEALRIEWSKVWARKRWWDEELALVLEEQRRSLESLGYEAERWQRRADIHDGPEGYRAYVVRQACLRTSLASRFKTIWSTPIRKRSANHRPYTGDTALGQEQDQDNEDSEEEQQHGDNWDEEAEEEEM
ncbi:hypothetical protein VNI00_003487 [Paramarasmius palmivorus]|uniref:CxC2-like cysteine cluster KDZ transposase-associated domain-containing protein n=1 Tax=Paramarasmius palmivorus TaxID=297713 RepID=A0AAW0DRM3_9AGAR